MQEIINDPSRTAEESPLMSPSEIASRWRCGRSTVDRIARREGFSRVLMGHGRNGMVRFWRKEVLDFEARRTIKIK